MTEGYDEWIPEPPRKPGVSDTAIGFSLLFVSLVSFVWGILVGATTR